MCVITGKEIVAKWVNWSAMRKLEFAIFRSMRAGHDDTIADGHELGARLNWSHIKPLFNHYIRCAKWKLVMITVCKNPCAIGIIAKNESSSKLTLRRAHQTCQLILTNSISLWTFYYLAVQTEIRIALKCPVKEFGQMTLSAKQQNKMPFASRWGALTSSQFHKLLG